MEVGKGEVNGDICNRVNNKKLCQFSRNDLQIQYTSVRLFSRNGQILKCVCKCKGPRIIYVILKIIVRRLILPDLKTAI